MEISKRIHSSFNKKSEGFCLSRKYHKTRKEQLLELKTKEMTKEKNKNRKNFCEGKDLQPLKMKLFSEILENVIFAHSFSAELIYPKRAMLKGT